MVDLQTLGRRQQMRCSVPKRRFLAALQVAFDRRCVIGHHLPHMKTQACPDKGFACAHRAALREPFTGQRKIGIPDFLPGARPVIPTRDLRTHLVDVVDVHPVGDEPRDPVFKNLAVEGLFCVRTCHRTTPC